MPEDKIPDLDKIMREDLRERRDKAEAISRRMSAAGKARANQVTSNEREDHFLKKGTKKNSRKGMPRILRNPAIEQSTDATLQTATGEPPQKKVRYELMMAKPKGGGRVVGIHGLQEVWNRARNRKKPKSIQLRKSTAKVKS